jgi:glyoxylase-like metal-dependent hydrolase (beta-lactamase superfamily II)
MDSFDVFAIRYATVHRNQAENFIGGDPHEAAGTMDYFVWVARSASRTIVIDTGFGAEAAKKRGRTLLRCPTEALRLIGVDAAEVEDVVITHLHYDHAGNLALFPKATFHIQDREMGFATGRSMCHSILRAPYDVEDVVQMVRNVYAERVRFHDGDRELFPGVSLHHIGGHCAGLQVVRLWTAQGWLVLASDAVHFYENSEKRRPFPIVHDVAAMLEGYDRVRQLADGENLVIPGHDPAVMERFAAVSGLAGVIAILA